MIWFKSCPRCAVGDMTRDEDGDRLCLQCGYVQRSAGVPSMSGEFADVFRISPDESEPAAGHTARREGVLAV